MSKVRGLDALKLSCQVWLLFSCWQTDLSLKELRSTPRITYEQQGFACMGAHTDVRHPLDAGMRKAQLICVNIHPQASAGSMGRVSSESWGGFTWRFPGVSVFRIVHRTWRLCGDLLDLVAQAIRNAIRANRFAWIIRNWNPYFTNPGTTPITILAVNSNHGLSFAWEDGPWSEFPFLYRFTVLLNSGGSILSFGLSFLILWGWGVVPAPSTFFFYCASGRFARITRISDSRKSRH